MVRLRSRILPGREEALRSALGKLESHEPFDAALARALVRGGEHLTSVPLSLHGEYATTALERRWRLAFALDAVIPPQLFDGLPARWSSEPHTRDTVLGWWATWLANRDAGRAPERLQAYVHVPWCRLRCGFCQYDVVVARDDDAMTRSVELLEQEAAAFRTLGSLRAQALTVGGGTPSALSAPLLARVLGALLGVVSRNDEEFFSVEFNPDSTDRDKLAVLAEHGVNRLSLGVQSFHPGTLRAVQRGYQSAEMVADAVRLARAEGDFQLSLDLLAPLPGETQASFAAGVRRAFELEPDQVVLYQYEPVTRGDVRIEPGAMPIHVAREAFVEECERRGYRRVPNTGTSVVAQHVDARTFPSRYLQHDREPSSLLALGPFAESHVFDVADYVGSPLGAEAPYHGRALAPREERARYLGRHFGGGLRIDREAYCRAFGAEPADDFPAEFAFLEERAELVEGVFRGDSLAVKRASWLFLDDINVERIADARATGVHVADRRWLALHTADAPDAADLVDVDVRLRVGADSREGWVVGTLPLEAEAARADTDALFERAEILGLSHVADVLAHGWIEGSLHTPRVHRNSDSHHIEVPLLGAVELTPFLERTGFVGARRPGGTPTAIWFDGNDVALAYTLGSNAAQRSRLPKAVRDAQLTYRFSLSRGQGTWLADVDAIEQLASRTRDIRGVVCAVEFSQRLEDGVVVLRPKSRRRHVLKTV